jgi:hypothetical protein
LKHELVRLGAKIDWDWIDREIAPLYNDKGRPAIAIRFVIGLLLLKHIYALSDEGVASAGSTIRISSTSTALSFSSTSSRTGVPTSATGARSSATSLSFYWPRA